MGGRQTGAAAMGVRNAAVTRRPGNLRGSLERTSLLGPAGSGVSAHCAQAHALLVPTARRASNHAG